MCLLRFESSHVKAPPLPGRRMMPPTPLLNSYSSFEEAQGHFEVEEEIWSARDRTVTARTKRYLEVSPNTKVEIEDLNSLLGPDDSDVEFRRIIEEASDKKVSRHLRPSTQRVRVNSWWSMVRDGTSTKRG